MPVRHLLVGPFINLFAHPIDRCVSVAEDKFINVLVKSIAIFDLCVNLWRSTFNFAVAGYISLMLGLSFCKMCQLIITTQKV